ncbi:MAG: hypothetical protein KDD78_04280, partial [Caldilineaceae bacterium]|nr:hypothetical protein [Caldilineaceae bacterium]
MSDRQAGHNSRPNPYVGPRSFEAGERLYGRDRETMDLLDLLIAERIVLLYSPSGAGKTSLLQAALIPELEREGFHVHPPLRVSQGDGAGFGGAGFGNRYAHSLVLALEDTRPTTDQLSAQALADFTLDGYLATRGVPPEQGEVFIFDQFEEVLTIDPADVDAKLAFFEQVGALLRNRQRWAIFAMREEFIAGLDPYLRAVPTRFSNRFRLELLAVHAARAAMQEPARAAGVAFTDPAADRLINDLSLVRIQDPDGVTREIPGTTIEPVQLQVVCRRLWDHLDADDQEIDMDDIAAIGDVNQALRDYLSTTLIAVARRTGVAERSMRDWIEHELITEQGLRGQVLQSAGSSRGLDNRVIDELVDAHLLRAENRRGARWLELAHDRLIDPVRKDNLQWRETNLSPLQRQAALWDQENRPAGLLMRGDELDAAEQWATEHPAVLTPREQDFLAAAHNARRLERRDHRMRAGLVVLTAASVLAALVAMLFFAQARRSEQVAEANLAKAEIAESTAQAEAARADRNALDADSKRREAERQLAVARSRQVAASALNR